MAKKNKKEQHQKKRKEASKRRKARKLGTPKLLRNEALADVISSRHPLKASFINEDWHEAKMANVLVVRDTPGGLVFASFLVDLAEKGLKDVWGNFGASWSDIDDIKDHGSRIGFNFIPCEQELVENIVHGGIEWAKEWGYTLPRDYKVWIRLLESPSSGPDLDLFGVDGTPLFLLDEGEVPDFDYDILSGRLQVDEDGVTEDLLTRIGDIKGLLIDFLKTTDFGEDIALAMEERFGESAPPESDGERIDFLDWFILEYEMEDGGTVIGHFIDEYDEMMSDDVRELVLGWKDVIQGLFEVKGAPGPGVDLKNLVNEKEYRAYPTVEFDEDFFKPGDFFYARIVPALNFHVFSGRIIPFSGDGKNEHFRAKMYREALTIQMKFRRLAFKDNPEKLQRSREMTRKNHADFTEYFGADEVTGTGRELHARYLGFFEFLVRDLDDRDKERISDTYPPQVTLHDEILESEDVGMLCDPVEGTSFQLDYGRFKDVFRSPDEHLGKEETREIVMGYLESDAVSDVPLRRMAERFPENFKRVIGYYRDREGFFFIRHREPHPGVQTLDFRQTAGYRLGA